MLLRQGQQQVEERIERQPDFELFVTLAWHRAAEGIQELQRAFKSSNCFE